MIAALVLVAVAAAAPPDLLDQARTAFAQADYVRAEQLALEAAAEPPDDTAALYLAGLARFREGRPAEALDAIDRAGSGADAPAAFHHNRAACLYELARYAEAESEYLRAADLDPALASVALVNAGFAALEAGAVDRARGDAARARAVATGAALDLVADLERQLPAAGGASTAPVAGDAIPSGAGATPAPGAAIAAAPRAPDDAFGGHVRLETGWDSNALQSGASGMGERAGTTASPTGSALATSEIGLSARRRLRDDLRGELGYGLLQLAYAAPLAADRSVQQHGLAARLELDLGERWRLGASVEGLLAFTGLSAFRGMQSAVGVRFWSALAESHAATTRLELGFAHQTGLASEFAYLGGERLEATLSQELRLHAVALGAGVRVLRDGLGDARLGAQPLPPSPTCPMGCTAEPLVAFGHDSATAWLSARVVPVRWFALELSGGVEWRRYLEADRLDLTQADGIGSVVYGDPRTMRRFLGGALATIRLAPRLSVLVRDDVVLSRPELAAGAGPQRMMMGSGSGVPDPATFAPDGRSYDKNVFTIGTSLAW
ncbi:hypothetical protein [Anaeromyxobacter oryzae]|uniref:Tetratricopeptide repeat protein n=1 Tax=Anaeromyxobacter oryzae TaxID=2918170 RepID=A0ABM7WS58_9BACT|nr:hypothetical protein [Anaeromyxobacter oryzae]BDG02268.1 hypothetical protein AMOR_12640 [Anaeromyxobacter oryzae]